MAGWKKKEEKEEKKPWGFGGSTTDKKAEEQPKQEEIEVPSIIVEPSTEGRAEGNEERKGTGAFGKGDYTVGSISSGIEWLNPNGEEEERKKFDSLTIKEKQLRMLIENQYPDASTSEKERILYFWKVRYLTSISENDGTTLAFFEPELWAWEPVFKRGTGSDAINFNLTFCDNYGFVLHPSFWAGHSMKYILFLYFLLLTKEYIVYVKDEELYYQFDGKRWLQKPEVAIIQWVSAWVGGIHVKGADRQFGTSSAERDLLGKFQGQLTIPTWPFVVGINFNNGFLTLEDGKYTLKPHHPGHWQKLVLTMDIPDEIIPWPNDEAMWWVLDMSAESVMNFNIFKLVTRLAIVPSNHNLIINFSGNPKGAKTIFLEFVRNVLGDHYKSGSLNRLNSFQREALLGNAQVIAFPDANPWFLNSEDIDLLKALSGRDPIQVETKFGKVYMMVSQALIFIVNNEDFDAVQAFKEPGMADRTLNFVVPSIRPEAAVMNLDILLSQSKNWMFFHSLSADPELLANTQRSSEANAVTGSGVEKVYLQFLITQCVYSMGAKTKGDDLYKAYSSYVRSIDKRSKPDNKQGFYKKLQNFADKLTPWGVERLRDNWGVAFANIIVAAPTKGAKGNWEEFWYEGPELLKELLQKNGFREDHILFLGENGQFIKGPWLDPRHNIATYKALEFVKDTNLKLLTGGKYKNVVGKHFEPTGFGSGRVIGDLSLEDFEEEGEIKYQPRLQYTGNGDLRVTDKGKFPDSPLRQVLSGEFRPMVTGLGPNFNEISALGGIHPDYWIGTEYNMESGTFSKEGGRLFPGRIGEWQRGNLFNSGQDKERRVDLEIFNEKDFTETLSSYLPWQAPMPEPAGNNLIGGSKVIEKDEEGEEKAKKGKKGGAKPKAKKGEKKKSTKISQPVSVEEGEPNKELKNLDDLVD